MGKAKVGIIGAAGYTAGELIRILLNHPEVELTSLSSSSQAGKAVHTIHQDLYGISDLVFEESLSDYVDLVFLCKGHGESVKIIEKQPSLLSKKIIDLSQDYRLQNKDGFVYGLPELYKNDIVSASHIANPGCFATAIQLGILPAVNARVAKGDIHVSGITGSTGAGQALSATTHFTWRQSNASVYKALSHQHLNEVGEQVNIQNSEWEGRIHFIPYRGAFTRGIITTSYFDTDLSDAELKEVYRQKYADAAFTTVTDRNPDLKLVINTNRAMVYPSVINGQVVVITIIDNLLKGASGQAVQNMNLLLGLEEKTGLHLKPSIF